MTPAQRDTIVEGLQNIIVLHGRLGKYPLSSLDSPDKIVEMVCECNAAVVRLAEAVLMLLLDADRPDV